MTTATKPKGLATKLAEVMAELDSPIPKKGFNKAQTYAFVSESDVSAAIRPLLAERGIWLWSSEVSHDLVPLFITSSGSQMWLTTVTMQFQFIDGETGEVTAIQTFSGQGADTGDKGLAKAISMALKYYLLKSFMLSTGKDDNESDERVDRAAAGAVAGAGSRIKGGKAPEGTQRGGKTDTISSTQVQEISRLLKDKNLDGVGFMAVAMMALEREQDAKIGPRDLLQNLTSEEAAKVIRALADLGESEAEPQAADEPEEAMSIV